MGYAARNAVFRRGGNCEPTARAVPTPKTRATSDRFDGIYAICEDKDKAFFAIETSELPQGARAGDVLKITDDGALSIDVEETERRRTRILEKQKKLMGL